MTMTYRDKLAKKADLGPGECLLGGMTATPAGGLLRNAASVGAGVALGAVGAVTTATIQQASDRNPAPVAGFPTAPTMAIGLTERRILVWGLSALTGSPSKLLGEVPVSSVRDVTWGNGKTLGIRNGVLELTLTNESVASLEVPRRHLKEGEAFAVALRALLPTAF